MYSRWLLPLLSTCILSCHPQTDDCPIYTDVAPGAESYDAILAKCTAAFGDGYSVEVRTCPQGLVPAACGSLTEYSGETILYPDDLRPDGILCCWE